VGEEQLFTRELVERVNHHLRTPLTVVLCHAELLVDQEHELPAGVHDSHVAVLRAAQRLDDVVLGVCELVAASVQPMTVETVDITEVVAEEVHAHHERAARRGVRFLTSGERPQACSTDAWRLRRALHELLDNAVTYAPDDSTVRVASQSSAGGTWIEVSDGGDGIDPADRERLTRPFERGTHPRQPVDGRGMGLALATVLTASIGGRLHLPDGPGPGLRVRIELPVDVTHRHHATTVISDAHPSRRTPPGSGR
jgi:signal transduction histidine kinase